MNSKQQFYARDRELAQLTDFLTAQGSGLTHLRGRRRVGKTELLRCIQQQQENCFYFMGRDDESNRAALKRFAIRWDAFTDQRRLTRLKASELSWDDALDEVSRWATRSSPEAPLIMLLDEVQWLSNKGVGFCGLIKEHWPAWKATGRVKLVLAGSSNRFFRDHVDGEMATLRGLRTHATIWVRPFTLAEVRQHYFPRWTHQEVSLAYMMLGGVPYYLENIAAGDNFIRSVNESIFCSGGIFLEEVDAMLKLETSTVGARTRVKEILASLGQDGATQAAIVRRTGLTQDYVHKTLDRLLDHDVVRERRPLGAPKRNRAGVRYHMDDFYLNAWFSLLRPLRSRIRGNRRGLLFPAEVLGSATGYYIPGFSGQAFELLISHVIKAGCDDESARTQPIFERLKLGSGRYQWGTYWEPGRTQIDLVVSGLDDREHRIIEAKWVSGKVNASTDFVRQVLAKQFPLQRGWRKSHYLVLSADCTAALRRRAAAQGVTIIGLEELF